MDVKILDVNRSAREVDPAVALAELARVTRVACDLFEELERIPAVAQALHEQRELGARVEWIRLNGWMMLKFYEPERR